MAAADDANQARLDAAAKAKADAAKAKADAEKAAADKATARQKRLDELAAERAKSAEEKVAARAASNPMFNPAVRPEAPQTEPGFIQYYSWIGGATTGQWRLYKAAEDSPMAASAEARSTGGVTQAKGGSAVGANVLSNNQSGFNPPPGKTEKSRVTNQDGSITITYSDGSTAVIPVKPGKTETGRVTNSDGSITVTYNDGSTATIPKIVNNNNNNTGFNSPAGPTLAKDVFKATLGLYFGEKELAAGWMDELYNAVSKFYLNGQDVATSFNMALLDARNNPNLRTFTDRFKGIYALQDLRQAGKPVSVPTIAEYVAAQKGMADVFNEVGLTDLATEQFTGDLIGKGNSVTTVAEKIAKAFQRIDLAPKAIKDTLSRYFPTVDRTTLARTLLTGQKGVDALVDELAQYEVLAAAEQQGLGAINRAGGLTAERAQEYARRGETFGSLTPQFSKIARALPTVQKLSGISGVQDMGQLGLEQAVINQSAQELQKLEQLSAQEEARFSGKVGRAETGLASQRRANRAF